jgi:glucose-1-phosphate cytidylyltransferase
MHNADITVDGRSGRVEFHTSNSESWRITLVDTGERTMTGGRLKRVRPYIAKDQSFCFTYGDGVSDLNVRELVAFHKTHGRKATLTAVAPPGRYGALSLEGDTVTEFVEKPPGGLGFINGGFFVLEPSVIDYIDGDETPWEAGPLERLAAEGELRAFRHDGFWQPMDTLRDKNRLEALWEGGRAPWKIWD